MSNLFTLNAYQDAALKTAIYPKDQALVYLALKLNGEAGEVAEKVGKCIRDSKPVPKEELAKELGDVLWYIANLADFIGFDLGYIADMNLEKLKSRQERGVLGGSGDNR